MLEKSTNKKNKEDIKRDTKVRLSDLKPRKDPKGGIMAPRFTGPCYYSR